LTDVVQIEVWADVVCPWCYIGKKRLQRALDARGLTDEVEIVHRGFQLDPTASDVPESSIEHLAHKYGVTTDAALGMMANVTEVAAGEGLRFRLADTMSANTADAHRLVLWAQESSLETAQRLLEELYAAYFEKAESIFTTDDLVRIAEKGGLDPDKARAVLTSEMYADRLREDQQLARDFGATGVPFFVIDRAVGISGAQPLEVFLQALDQVAAHPSA
jgi:predicted DsbA family dithiol-disulfide isomerase